MQCPVRILACTSTLLLLAFTLPADAQDATAPARNNAAYFEFLGNGGVFSINYERAVTPSLRLRLGAASWTSQSFWSDAKTRFEIFPLMLHVVPGRGAHRFEAAIGVLPGHRGRQRDIGESGGFVSLTGLIGYRYEPPGRRLVFRAGVTPFYGFGDSAIAYPDDGFLPSLGLSFGARFCPGVLEAAEQLWRERVGSRQKGPSGHRCRDCGVRALTRSASRRGGLMISSRGLAAVPIILLCALADARAQSNPEKALWPEAKAVMDKARDTYRNLAGYYFERVLLVQEAREDGKLANIAELTLAIASENVKPAPDSRPFPGVNLDRFRVEIKTKQNEVLQVCDGRICWSYTSLKNEYMTGQRFRDVSSSVGGSVMLGVHLFGFMTLEEEALQDAKLAREEEVDVGKERRKCYVIEGVIQPSPRPRPNEPPAGGRPGVDWLLSVLALQGLAGEGRRTLYSPWPPDENAAGVGEPTRVTLWIDQNAHVVVRTRMSAQLYKLPVGKEGQAAEKVAMAVTDSFTTATIEAPPGDLFHFTPPDGAKEVPNVASRREKK